MGMRNAKKSKAGPAARKRKKGRGRMKKNKEFGARKTAGSKEETSAVEMTSVVGGGQMLSSRPARLGTAETTTDPRSHSSRGSRELGLPATAVKRKSSWRSRRDPASGNTYFYNKETGVTTWNKPDDYDGPEITAAVRGSAMAAATKRQTMQYAS